MGNKRKRSGSVLNGIGFENIIPLGFAAVHGNPDASLFRKICQIVSKRCLLEARQNQFDFREVGPAF